MFLMGEYVREMTLVEHGEYGLFEYAPLLFLKIIQSEKSKDQSHVFLKQHIFLVFLSFCSVVFFAYS